MARQANKQGETTEYPASGRKGVSRPDGIADPGADCVNHQDTYCAKIQVRDRVRHQATRMRYVHLQKYALVEETLHAKEAFEYASTHGISVKAYHANNGIFKANKWVESCRKAGQGLTFAGVSSHHENGIAERRIKEIQDARQDNTDPCQWKMSVKMPTCGRMLLEWHPTKLTTYLGCRQRTSGRHSRHLRIRTSTPT
jgi:hypothetical protein